MPNKALQNFDPNAPGDQNNTVFGLPFSEEDAALSVIPVPWDATVSYREGTALGPEQVLESSYQVDLYDRDAPGLWKQGIYMNAVPGHIHQSSMQAREKVVEVLEKLEKNQEIKESDLKDIQQVNAASIKLNEWVYTETKRLLEMGKHTGLLGGDHSSPLGHIKAVAEKHAGMSILQIDAHMDLRQAYEGFTYSHASIMYNVRNEIPQVAKIVQVGLRDFCDEEVEWAAKDEHMVQFFDQDIKEAQFKGASFDSYCEGIVSALDDEVYVSFDIDGLVPALCPHTGTPVPGGLQMEEAFYILQKIVDSGRRLVAFDLCEVAGDEDNHSIDSIVGARLLYKLSLLVLKSHE